MTLSPLSSARTIAFMSVTPADGWRTTLIFVVSRAARGPVALYRMLIGPPCADLVAFLKPAGIAAAKPLSLLVTRPEDVVVVDVLLKLAVVAVVFGEVAAGVVAGAASERDEDDEDPQPARASAAVAASATAPYRIDDRESAMLTGLLLGERRCGCPRRPSPAALSESEGMPQAPFPNARAVGDTGLDPRTTGVGCDPPRCRGVCAVGSQYRPSVLGLASGRAE